MVISFVLLLLSAMLIVFIFNWDTENTFSVPNDVLFHYLKSIDLFSIVQLPEFWLASYQLADTPISITRFIHGYSIFSVLVFTLGLMIVHRYILKITRLQFSLLSLGMGLLHVLVAKVLLSYTTHELLIGPFLSSGVYSLLYFSLLTLVLCATYTGGANGKG